MFFALTWGLALVVLALWSLTCWSLHAVTLWAITSAGTLTGGTVAVDAALVPAWLQIWMPPEMVELFQALVASFGPMVQSLLAMVPALGGLVTVLAWAIWGFGALTVLALAFGARMVAGWLTRQRMLPNATRV